MVNNLTIRQDNDLPYIEHEKTTIHGIVFNIGEHAIIEIAGFAEPFQGKITDIRNHILVLNELPIELNNCVAAKKLDLNKSNQLLHLILDEPTLENLYLQLEDINIDELEKLSIVVNNEIQISKKDAKDSSNNISDFFGLESERVSVSLSQQKDRVEYLLKVINKLQSLQTINTEINRRIDEIKMKNLSADIKNPKN